MVVLCFGINLEMYALISGCIIVEDPITTTDLG
jgi:hypothetical protein